MPQKELQVAQHAITNQGKKFKPTLDIKIKGGTTHTHADIDNIAIIKVGCGLIKSSYN